MTWILSVLKYWKTGGIVILIAAFLLSMQLAHRRGHERDRIQSELTRTIKEYNALEKARQQDKSRNEFRKKQNRKIKFAQNDPVYFPYDLRDVYDSLRQRQAADTN